MSRRGAVEYKMAIAILAPGESLESSYAQQTNWFVALLCGHAGGASLPDSFD